MIVFLSTASGLQVLRDNNVIHRDLKPQVLFFLSYFILYMGNVTIKGGIIPLTTLGSLPMYICIINQ